MTTFIDDVVKELLQQPTDISRITIVLPSKRAGTFFIESLSKHLEKVSFAPEIISIEEFIETVSGFKTLSNTELLFEFYEVYLNHTPSSQVESFETFSKWAQIIVQDFNEIDRYLVPPESIFDYLNAIKKIENQHWSLDSDQTEYIKNYLAFWDRLKLYYHHLQERLISVSKGYQGMVYRQAVLKLEDYLTSTKDLQFVFAGFNALNTSEETLIKKLLEQKRAQIYWDIDDHFLEDPVHDAGLFIRSHKGHWSHFENNGFKKFKNYYQQEKVVRAIGTPKNIGQVKYVGQLLETMVAENVPLDNTAVVLSDEALLIPLLNSLPKNLDAVNITMGLPLQHVSLTASFAQLFKLHINYRSKLYYKDLIGILNDPYFKKLFNTKSPEAIIKWIKQNNLVYLTLHQLSSYASAESESLALLFSNLENNPEDLIDHFQKIILKLKLAFESATQTNYLELEYLFRFNAIFNELKAMNQKFGHIKSIATLDSLYKELLQSETLDFKGEPLQGLQIMGMLETRLLDFERVIITSVNEGILPAGKSNNSFIPFDVKVENKLPTFKEKDAVYTYHFYRLLQRAKQVDIIYNTEPDVLGGAEKSRFITQMEVEGIHHTESIIAAPEVPTSTKVMTSVQKSEATIQILKEVALKGFSPSSLTAYIRNPMDFYQTRILGIKDMEEVEESVAANTLGTVLHNTLEDFYKPLQGQVLTSEMIEKMTGEIDGAVSGHFQKEFKEGDLTKGKNLIIFEIAKRYIHNFLQSELRAIASGNHIKIIAIEVEVPVGLSIDGLDFDINLTGKVDRVDELNGVMRVVDYKSGAVEPAQVKISDWSLILSDYKKYSKSFQVLMYTYLMHKASMIELPVEAGIISFRRLAHGILKFEDTTANNASKHLIDEQTLLKFEGVLKELIMEIFNPELPFEEKEVT